jgi:hypothetical protein
VRLRDNEPPASIVQESEFEASAKPANVLVAGGV